MNGLLVFIVGLLLFSLVKDRRAKQTVPVKKKSKKKSEQGFSLTEMSVSIAVIAAIAGAVLEGRNLIDDAKERAIISEVSKYKLAFNAFFAKYDKYPGDFNESVAFWGAGTNADGDNNGNIEFKNSNNIYEGYRAWQHLYYSKMIEAVFPGTQTTSAAVLNTDVPKSRSGGGYFLDYGVFGMSTDNVLALGAPVATSATPILVNGIFNPQQALNLDAKADDGMPNTGSIRGQKGNASAANTCSKGSASTDAYDITLSGIDCTLGFKVLNQ